MKNSFHGVISRQHGWVKNQGALLQDTLRQMKMKVNMQKHMGCKREIYICNAYIKKEERYQIDNLILYLKELEKEEKTNPKPVQGRKENAWR